MRKLRCAVYTRKSSEEGLDQDFNSLDAQREACAAYVESQKHEGWVLLPDYYDDGGLSGGTMNRPALQKLLADVDEGLVDQIVVYKIDRLTRSLADFAKLVDRLDAVEASFVSVTQSFNTSTSMGRLTLNVLLSFAQFEREVTAERIRDKISASKKKGLWMGGNVPLGYEADGRVLAINEAEAETVRTLFGLYQTHGTVRAVKEQADELDLKTKHRPEATCEKRRGGNSFDRGHIHAILSNPVYAGRIRHKDIVHSGQHEPIIEPEQWDQVQEQLQAQSRKARGKKSTAKNQSLLTGKIFDENDQRLTPSHARKGERRYRYYVSHHLIAESGQKAMTSNWRLPARHLEDQIAKLTMQHLQKSGTRFLLQDATTEQISRLHHALPRLGNQSQILACLDKVQIKPGTITTTIDRSAIAELLTMPAELISEDQLQFSAPFQFRKHGVETKLVMEEGPSNLDKTLIRNIRIAHKIVHDLKAGGSIDQIAREQNTTRQRITELSKLAFLSPEITEKIIKGVQPAELTSDFILKRPLPICWNAQDAILNRLH